MQRFTFSILLMAMALCAFAQRPKRVIPDTPPGPGTFTVTLLAHPDTLPVGFTIDGVSTTSALCTSGQVLTLHATMPEGYRFRAWSDGVTLNPRTLIVQGDSTLTALPVRLASPLQTDLSVCELAPGQLELRNQLTTHIDVVITTIDGTQVADYRLNPLAAQTVTLPAGTYHIMYISGNRNQTIRIDL